MTRKLDDTDIMLNVLFDKKSGHFTFCELTDEGKASDDHAEPGEWTEYSDWLEPGEFYAKLKEIFGV